MTFAVCTIAICGSYDSSNINFPQLCHPYKVDSALAAPPDQKPHPIARYTCNSDLRSISWVFSVGTHEVDTNHGGEPNQHQVVARD